MNFDEFGQLADQMRELPLESVLRARHAVRDRRDQCKWHTDQGPISITGTRFMNWQQGVGGGKAIDLALHLGERDFRAAVLWLARNVAGIITADPLHTPRSSSTPAGAKRALRLPVRNDDTLSRVIGYLVHQRRLPGILVNALIDDGRLYADERGNAVFLMLAASLIVWSERNFAALANRVGVEWRRVRPKMQASSGSVTQHPNALFSVNRRSTRSVVTPWITSESASPRRASGAIQAGCQPSSLGATRSLAASTRIKLATTRRRR